ncbi:Hypothetical predicted protein [Lecanosticta acicola]|uniref:Small ribosomal subunit protein mS29 n=1 Tax=Lecanosticta acicola TaxID=111012 RepID=A0AAI9EAU6_9PEZI|nr:Hypothetical predicted protein [Lecanosticta acicola]
MAKLSPPLCLRCLRRTLDPIERSTPAGLSHRAAFSTSPSHSVNPPKKKSVVAKPSTRQGRTLRLTKNTRASTAKPPAVGERKAQRKRVVLSNSNALEVVGLKDLASEHTRSRQLELHQGQVLGLSNETVDALRALEAFKPTQGWSLFRRPATLIRKETLTLAGDLEQATERDATGLAARKDGATDQKEGEAVQRLPVRKVLFGERGSGKSVLQLQALALAHLENWVVVHVPEAKDLTNAHTSYQPLFGPTGVTYIQPHYTAKLLENINKANQPLFSKMRVSQRHNISAPLQPNSTLEQLVSLGARDPAVAWPVWQALWNELLLPSNSLSKGEERPPVMFALDGVDHIMRHSAYLNTDAVPIHAHELALVEHFVSMLAGKIEFPNGGMLLAATSESNRASAHTLDQALANNLAIQDGTQSTRYYDPYVAHDILVRRAMRYVSVQKVRGISKDEARGIMEYYAKSGILRSTVTDGLIGEKWTLAGGGIVGQIENGTVRARF